MPLAEVAFAWLERRAGLFGLLALATIVDSHLTALIAAIAMFALGSGPIRGFAVAFAIGLASTLFTSYLLTRLIVSTWVRQARPKVVPL